jgi:hypothetical protein
MDEDISSEDGYRISFSGQTIPHIHTTAKINGEIVKFKENSDPKNIISEECLVEYPDGRVVKEKIENLLFPYRFLKE